MVLSLTDTVRKLQSYNNLSFPIISAYIPKTDKDTSESLTRKFLNFVDEHISGKEQESASDDLLYIEHYLRNHYAEIEKGTFVFFSGGNALWEVIKLPETVTMELKLDHSIYLMPLLTYIEQFSRYLVVVVDRQRATLFTLYLGELEQHKTVRNKDVPQKMKGRNSQEKQSKIDRHIRDHLHRHFLKVLGEIENIVEDVPVTSIILAGHSETLHAFEKELPTRFRKKVIGSFVEEPKVDIDGLIKEAKSFLSQKGQHTYQHESFFLPR